MARKERLIFGDLLSSTLLTEMRHELDTRIKRQVEDYLYFVSKIYKEMWLISRFDFGLFFKCSLYPTCGTCSDVKRWLLLSNAPWRSSGNVGTEDCPCICFALKSMKQSWIFLVWTDFKKAFHPASLKSDAEPPAIPQITVFSGV